MSKYEERILTGKAEIRNNEDGTESRSIKGEGIVFGKWSHPIAGLFRERILPTALDGVDLTDVVATRNHNFDKPLGRTKNNTLQLKITERGLEYDIKNIPNTSHGNDTLEDVRSGLIDGSSFMFGVEDDDWNFETDSGIAERTINKISRVVELGPVTMPAYPDASSYRSSMEEYEAARSEFQKAKEVNKNLVPNTVEDELRYDLMRAKYNF